MTKKQLYMFILCGILLIVIVILLLVLCFSVTTPENSTKTIYTFPTQISSNEQNNRIKIVVTAKSFLGCNESDGTHKEIIDIYNGHQPLAVNYKVKYSDEWCAAFVSAVAIKCGMTQIIPTECGCERQIQLFQKMNRWIESDAYIPLPGDYIFYHTDHSDDNECLDWSDHVGIVVAVSERNITVIEGNYSGAVRYRTIQIDHVSIRGFGVPDYADVAN